MEIEFDPAKDAFNIAKHGVSLTFGAAVMSDADTIFVPTVRIEDGEQRYKAIGIVEGKPWTAVYVNRGTAIRLISVRRSNDNEERAYRHSRRPR